MILVLLDFIVLFAMAFFAIVYLFILNVLRINLTYQFDKSEKYARKKKNTSR